MRKQFATLLTFLMCVTAVPVLGHHSFDAEFDRNKTVEVVGKVTKVEWMNPHAWFYADVTNANGEIEKWQFELGAPNALRRAGWGRNSLQVGDEVSVTGSMAKDGTNTVNARSIVLSTGERVLAGSSEGNSRSADATNE